MNARLFKFGRFTAASGRELDFKVECNAFTSADWREIAAIAAPRIPPFREVYGVPTGGVVLADSLRPYCNLNSRRILVVDDVWTSGGSMQAYMGGAPWRKELSYEKRESLEIRAFALFVRGNTIVPPWVDFFWRLGLSEQAGVFPCDLPENQEFRGE